MDKFIAHVFPNYDRLNAHIREIWDEQRVFEIDKTRNRYTERDGTVHWCFVVRKAEDVHDFLGMDFFEHHIHGDFHHLKPMDEAYMRISLRHRTRHVPEVA